MRIDAVLSFLDQRIAELEKQVYVFEEVVVPRAEVDKRILKSMRDSRIKVLTLRDKVEMLRKRKEAGEEVPESEEITRQELMDCLPQAFR